LDANDPQYCQACREQTDTVLRWAHSDNFIVWSFGLGKNITVASEWDRGWRCVRCVAVQDYLQNGCPGSDGCFKGVCRRCRGHVNFEYADGRDGWCCTICRLERREGYYEEVGRDEAVGKVYAGWCDNCEEMTHSARVDVRQGAVWVCAECRTECEEPDWEDEYEASLCGHCGHETFTVEIGTG
jgi:hypothetical protein